MTDTLEGNDLRRNVAWIRDPRNPVLPPGPAGSFDSACCMNPWCVRVGDTYRLYYGGGEDDGRRRICLATAPVAEPRNFTRHGPRFDNGAEGEFDARWCVLPHVIQVESGEWRLYYTGNCGQGRGLSAFPGVGLARSDDGLHWEKHDDNPILSASGREGDPDAIGIAGGSVLKVRLPEGGEEWRFYYTGCPTLGDTAYLDQQKRVCLATSEDGVQWVKRGALMLRRDDCDYEDIASAGPVVHQLPDGSYRMWYSAIGSRWGYYSVCYAESEDGLEWRRGSECGDNLQLAPIGDGWEKQMVEYPSVVREGSRLRLFYCGNGYGRTGIGTATSAPLRVEGRTGPCLTRVVAAEVPAHWSLRIPEGLSCDEGVFKVHFAPMVSWQGPDSDGTIWHEWETNPEDFAVISSYPDAEKAGLRFIQGLRYRVSLTPSDVGVEMEFEATNRGASAFHNVTIFPCLGHPSANFEDAGLERTYIVTDEGLTPLCDTDRGTGDPVRTHYRISGKPAKKHCHPAFWGEASKTTAVANAILRRSADGRFTVGMSWEASCELFHNEDAHHCIHSVALIPVLPPGETAAVRGRIVLLEGPPAEALDALIC